MISSKRRHRRQVLLRIWLLALAVIIACGTVNPSTQDGSETHFLQSCDRSCPTGTECLCGVCTRSCTETLECAAVSQQAICEGAEPRVLEGRCLRETVAFCDVPCLVDRDCAVVAGVHRCQSGYCREQAESEPPVPGAGGECEASTISGDQMLVMGDSLIELTTFTSSLEQQAVESGVLGTGEHFRDLASSLDSRLSEGSLSIASQWASFREESSARVVIMDGGETDMFEGLCDTNPQSQCANVQNAARGAKSLLEQMARDGVEHVVYFFYADPLEVPDMKKSLDVLRPLIENACGQSHLACHWVDLREAFVGHPEYYGSDGLLFSSDGAAVVAGLVWKRLQERCVVP